MDIDTSQLSILAVEAVNYSDNETGYNRDYHVTIQYRDKRFSLLFQPQEPIYLSAEWISRQNGGDDINGFSLDPSATEDDTFSLVHAMQAEVGDGDGDDYDYLDEINRYILNAVEMIPA